MNENEKFELLSIIIDYADNVSHCQRFLDKNNYEWAKWHREQADHNWEQIKLFIDKET